MDIILSLMGILACIAGFLFCSWRANRPHDGLEPRMTPWKMLMMMCAVLLLLIVAHLLNLAGLETGPDKSPFRMR